MTHELQTEIRGVMDDYWARYFHGDLDAWLRYLPDDYRNIGSTEVEIWNSKEEVLNYTHAVIDQMVGNVDFRNKQVQIIPYPPYFMVHELGDLYIHAGNEWAFYAKFRLSSLIQHTDDGWKVLHQHGSYPDAKAQEGESFGFEKISRENQELREAVKRRTVELQHKNRELEIEAALERVRTVAMSMRTPDDLLRIAEAVFNELRGLGFKDLRNAIIHTYFDEKKEFFDYDFSHFSGGTISRIPYGGNPVIERFIRDIRKSRDAFTEMTVAGTQLDKWKAFRKANGEVDDPRLEAISALYYANYSVGDAAIGISTFSPVSEAERDVLKRFRNAFDFAYKRYTDVARAEAQAREAQIEAALERVRSRTIAMQNSNELADASFLLDSQVRALGIKTWGCAFNIYGNDESTEWFSSEAGTMPTYKTPRENVFLRYYEAGQKGEAIHIEEFAGDVCVDHYNYLCTVPVVGDALKKVKESGGSFPTHQVDHATYFKYGYLLFITLEPVPDAHEVFIRFAKVFEQTYTRFLDLQKAEAQAEQARLDLIQIQTEKRRAEDALTELRATQAQLIQKEKLASLGELTAGIAHEIQNPLNFVNNFAEVSTELIAELEEERQKPERDAALEADLIADLTQNLEKITHHGQRASGIVRGMLEHARSSTGERQPTDLNALADEYLRLAYQGFRAKNKEFTGELLTEFAPDLPLVPVIPPDLGRVLLNLFNNAFYAIREKQKTAPPDYRATLTVSTGSVDGAVEIRVRDNGTGLAEAVKAKIFQPFFTTKPTGEGTGLGLSLSYDIVTKGHGGTLTVRSVTGEFSEFLMVLPA